ncbi:MAG: F0F1 ATP synthase subunit epsilon [Nitrospinota bacterium]
MAIKETFRLEIVTPDRKVVDIEAKYFSAPGMEGEFGVLPGHTEFFTILKPGEILYKDSSGERLLAVSWGYVEVKPESVVVLAENAEPAEELDVERARKKMDYWEKELAALKPEDKKQKQYQAKFEREQARIYVASRLLKK